MASVRCSTLPKLSNMWIFVVLTAFCSGFQASGEFIVAHAPDYLRFSDSSVAQDISTTDIPKLITSSFGYSVSKDFQWDGLKQSSVFRRPKASVLVSVEGHQQPLNIKNIARYTCKADDGVVDTQDVVDSIQTMATDSQPLLLDFSVDNTIFDVKSHYPELFRELPATYGKVKELFMKGAAFSPAQLGSLNVTRDEDLMLLGELHVMQQIATTLKSRREVTKGRLPDFYHFKVRGMADLARVYGQDSAQVKDAQALLEAVLSKVTQDFKELYSNNVVVQVVSLPVVSTQRHTRSLLEETDGEPQKNIEEDLGYGPDWDDTFPVVFNIILWTMVALTVAIIAISIGMWNMDPGRDSIIYRMTSQRIKKE